MALCRSDTAAMLALSRGAQLRTHEPFSLVTLFQLLGRPGPIDAHLSMWASHRQIHYAPIVRPDPATHGFAHARALLGLGGYS